MFPHFVLNGADPIFPLSDASCHSKCVSESPVGIAAVEARQAYFAKSGPGKRLCAVCGIEVTDPDDYFQLLYLAAPGSHPIAAFNFTNLHRSHIGEWRQRERFLELAAQLRGSGAWAGPALDKVIRELEMSKDD